MSVPWVFTCVQGLLCLWKSTSISLVFPALSWRWICWHQFTKSFSVGSVVLTIAELSENFCRWLGWLMVEVCGVQLVLKRDWCGKSVSDILVTITWSNAWQSRIFRLCRVRVFLFWHSLECTGISHIHPRKTHTFNSTPFLPSCF